MNLTIVNPTGFTPGDFVRDGRLQVRPATDYAATSREFRAILGHQFGAYSLPTVELIEWLRHTIGGRSAIEIGAGNGVTAAALGIPATDSKMQERPEIAALYASLGQPPVSYGPNVEPLDSQAAIEAYRPQVVVACWVTHRYDDARPWAGGNMWGVDEDWILERCDTYIHIGNARVHQHKAIWRHPHEIIEPEWLYSRATNGSANQIAVWDRPDV